MYLLVLSVVQLSIFFHPLDIVELLLQNSDNKHESQGCYVREQEPYQTQISMKLNTSRVNLPTFNGGINCDRPINRKKKL